MFITLMLIVVPADIHISGLFKGSLKLLDPCAKQELFGDYKARTEQNTHKLVT